jgi:restriction endonuclease S subunit
MKGKTKTLNEIMQFTLGKNPTRIKKSKIDLYTPEDFERDLHDLNDLENEGICIINLINSKAAPISISNIKKCATSNFLKCEFDESVMDSWYFCYKFNEGKDLEQQIAMFHQGTTLSVKKLNVKTVGELKIRLPDLEKQKVIGEMYRQSIIQNDLRMSQVENIRNLTLNMIRKIEED